MIKELLSAQARQERLALLELDPMLVRMGAISLVLTRFLKEHDIQIHSEEVTTKLHAIRESLDYAITIQKNK